jgi:hypothetical protein
MKNRFWISFVVMFLMAMGIGFLVHGTPLHNDYARLV